MAKAILLALMTLLALNACSDAADSASDSASEPAQGKAFEPAALSRVVSLSPGLSLTIVTFGAGDKLVGVDQFAPQSSVAIEKAIKAGTTSVIGDPMNPSYEAIVALNPDLVIAEKSSFAHRYGKLESLGIQLKLYSMESLSQMRASWETLAADLGCEAKAEPLLKAFDEAIEALPQASEPSVTARAMLSYTSPDRGDLQLIGPLSYQSQILERFGVGNVLEADQSFVQLSAEKALGLKPDLIIVIPFGALSSDPQSSWSKLHTLDAVKTGQVFELDFEGRNLQDIASVTRLALELRQLVKRYRTTTHEPK